MNEKFVQNVLNLCGDPGKSWLGDLPRLLAEIATRLAIKVDEPFSNLSYNYVAPCVCADGVEAVLKIALPLDNPEIFNEARYLKITNGAGAVKLLALDENNRAMLLEKLAPGRNLKEVCRGNEATAVEIAIPILRSLLKPPPKDSAFVKLDEWFNNFFTRARRTNFPAEIQNKARRIYKELSSKSQKFLIHGDLHHENILSAGREPFLAIDPKGVAGEVGYEIAVFLNNHLWWLAGDNNLNAKMNDAVGRFSKAFKINTIDLRKWAYLQIVLSAWWTFEENGATWGTELAFADFWEV